MKKIILCLAVILAFGFIKRQAKDEKEHVVLSFLEGLGNEYAKTPTCENYQKALSVAKTRLNIYDRISSKTQKEVDVNTQFITVLEERMRKGNCSQNNQSGVSGITLPVYRRSGGRIITDNVPLSLVLKDILTNDQLQQLKNYLSTENWNTIVNADKIYSDDQKNSAAIFSDFNNKVITPQNSTEIINNLNKTGQFDKKDIEVIKKEIEKVKTNNGRVDN